METGTKDLIAIASDHAGFDLKQALSGHLIGEGFDLLDLGTNGTESVDYPDFANAAAQAIISGQVERAIVFCGSGAGASIAANKVPGVRAAVCHDTYSAHQAVEHDNMNILCIGARVVGGEVARELVTAFLTAQLLDDQKYQRRLAKVVSIEQRSIK